MTKPSTIIRSQLAILDGDPFTESFRWQLIEDGAVHILNGQIAGIGDYARIKTQASFESLVDARHGWLVPGFIDTHLHFPQTIARAKPANQLLDWLDRQIFPAEMELADTEHAALLAEAFCAELMGCGTTTAAVFGSQYIHANMALAQRAIAYDLQVFVGPSLMDLAAPSELQTPANQVWDQAQRTMSAFQALPGRINFAITPRFALSCSPSLVDVCRQLAKHHPDMLIQSHINESPEEITSVLAMFPEARSYLDVYIQQGLVNQRTLLAHSIHSSDAELAVMAELDVKVAHCPTSNAYLGSGIHNLSRHREFGVHVGLGTDIGAGLNFSMLDELRMAFLVQKLAGTTLTAAQLLYLATAAGAKSLSIDDQTGSLTVGKAADLVWLNPARSSLLRLQLDRCNSLEEHLFACLLLGGQQLVEQVWTSGQARL